MKKQKLTVWDLFNSCCGKKISVLIIAGVRMGNPENLMGAILNRGQAQAMTDILPYKPTAADNIPYAVISAYIKEVEVGLRVLSL